jgi:hypothetical protein
MATTRCSEDGSRAILMRKVVLQLLLLLAVGAANALSLAAQTPARQVLESARTLNCTFSLLATGTWTDADPRAEVKPAKLSIRFDSIDLQDGTAKVAGMLGPSYAIAKMAEGALHLLVIDNAGPLYVTTVFDRETKGGRLRAVHTRHEYTDVSLPGFTSRPEQYYGECEVGK